MKSENPADSNTNADMLSGASEVVNSIAGSITDGTFTAAIRRELQRITAETQNMVSQFAIVDSRDTNCDTKQARRIDQEAVRRNRPVRARPPHHTLPRANPEQSTTEAQWRNK